MKSREIDIERQLLYHLSGSEFERFGNLYLRHFYKKRYPQTKQGSQLGNNSTVTGQPDSYFSLPGHKFKFAEITKQKDNLKAKLKSDITACLNATAHGIMPEQITDIDLVFAGRLASAQEQEEIAKPAEDLGIRVIFHSIDEIVHATVENVWLAKALGTPIDTGQILSVEKFIAHHEDSQLIVGTPLSNTYLERAEYEQFCQHFEGRDIVVLQGKPGVGKTKLALRYLQCFRLEKEDSEAYCVIHQPPAIWEDVLACFEEGKNYAVLIDDADRQSDNLDAVLCRLRSLRTVTYKIIITVRGYAVAAIRQLLLTEGYKFNELTLGQMSYEQISAIISAPPFEILRGDYQYKINRLADGNARLAIMMAILANADGYNFDILSNVSQIYDEYYQRVLPDRSLWTDKERLRVLGVSALLRVIDITNVTDLEPILTWLNMTATTFWYHVRHFATWEIVEIYEDDAYRFTEQTFASYAFYQCFVAQKALHLADAFDLVLTLPHIDFRLREAIHSVYESHDKAMIWHWAQPVLATQFKTLTTDQDRLAFLDQYERFLPNEVLSFIHDYANGRVTVDKLGRFGRKTKDEVLDLLFNYLNHTVQQADSLIGYELAATLLKYELSASEDVGKKLNDYLATQHDYINIENSQVRYTRYDWLSDYLTRSVEDESETYQQLMTLALPSFLLMFYDIAGDEPIYRNRIFRYVDQQLATGDEAVKAALVEYLSKDYGNLDEARIQDDIDRVSQLLRRYFSPDHPLDCLHVQRYVQKLNKVPLNRRPYQVLESQFNGEAYQLYCILSYEHVGRRERSGIDIANSKALRIRKRNEFRTVLAVKRLIDFQVQYQRIYAMWTLAVQGSDAWPINEGFTDYLLMIAEEQPQLFLEVFHFLVDKGFPPKYREHSTLLNKVFDNGYVTPEDIYEVLHPINESSASQMLTLLWSIPKERLGEQWLQVLHNQLPIFAHCQSWRVADPGFIKKFSHLDPTLPSTILELLWEQKTVHRAEIHLWDQFIEDFGPDLDPALNTALEQLYLDQYFNQQGYDHDHKALDVLLSRRQGFWLDLLNAHYGPEGYRKCSFRQFSFIWLRSDYQELISDAIELIKARKLHDLRRPDVESFFSNVPAQAYGLANQFITTFVAQHSNDLDLIDALNQSVGDCTWLDYPFIQTFLFQNTSFADFERIDWIMHGKGGVRSRRPTIMSEELAQEWEVLLKKVKTMPNPLVYLRHCQFIQDRITTYRAYVQRERREHFIRGYM